MKRAAAVAAAAAAAALAPAAPAATAYRPSLLVSPVATGLGDVGAVEISFAQRPEDDATAALSVHVPAGYGVPDRLPPRGRIGSATAWITTHFFGGAPLLVAGPIVSGDLVEAGAALAPCGAHARALLRGRVDFHPYAVWRATLAMETGHSLVVRILVDPAPSGLQLHVCLPSPHLPEAEGGARFGVKLLSARLTIDGVFRNPASPGRHVWRALFTPYVPGTATHGTTVEARAIVPVPARVTLAPTLVRRDRTGQVVLTGRVTEVGAAGRGAPVELYSVTNPRARSRRARLVAIAHTGADGRFSFRRAAARTRWYAVVAKLRDVTASACAEPVASGGCVSALVAPQASRLVKVAAPRRR